MERDVLDRRLPEDVLPLVDLHSDAAMPRVAYT